MPIVYHIYDFSTLKLSTTPMRLKKILLISASSLIALEIISQLYERSFLQADSYDLRHNMEFKFGKNIWRYKPNTKVIAREKTGNITYQINEMGYRITPKNSTTKLDPHTVLFIGDSVAFGLCSNQSIPHILQAKLGNNYDFKAMALPGYNPKDYYYNYLHLKDKSKLQTIMVMSYMNDLTDPSIIDQAEGNVSQEKKLSLAKKISKIPEIILSFSALNRSIQQSVKMAHFYTIRSIERSNTEWSYRKERQPQEALASLHKNQAIENIKYLKKLIREARKNKHNVFVIYSPHEASLWTTKYQQIGDYLLSFAEREGAITINLEPELRQLPNKSKKNLYCDGLHFTSEGNEVVSQLLNNKFNGTP
jgi:hypothetical protein